MTIDWNMTGPEIEQESFRRIEKEIGAHNFPSAQWPVVRRLIHTSADFTIAGNLHFAHNPIEAGLKALADVAPIYCDSNMIRSGLSLAKLQQQNRRYNYESIYCYVADPEVAEEAGKRGVTRSLAALKKARPVLNGGIVLVGNAPLALAGIARMISQDGIRPRLVIGMPVGFVNVIEAKNMIMETGVPQIVLKGRRGGSPLSVAALHGIMENKPGI